MDVLQQKTIKAKKVHKCIWCGENIEPGEIYNYQVVIFQGDFQSNHWHLECSNAANECSDDIEDGFDAYMFKRGEAEYA